MNNGNDPESDSLDEAIAHRAYQIWESEGRPVGRDLDHWARAEDEILLHGGSLSGKRERDASLAPPNPRAAGKRSRKPDPNS